MTSFLKFIIWMASVRLSKILILVFCALILVPLIVHYYLYKVEQDAAFSHHSHSTLDILDFSALKASDLKYRISEMLRMKASVSNELKILESKSQKLQNDITSYHQKIEQLKLEMNKQQSDLNRLKLSVQQAQLSHLEALQRNSPELAPPLVLVPSKLPVEEKPAVGKLSCHRMRNCFDYSRCSLTSGFPVFLYDPEEFFPSWEVPDYLKTLAHQTLSYNPHFTKDPLIACVYLILSGESHNFNATFLKNLPYWGGDGRNHIILNLSSKIFNSSIRLVPSAAIGRAIIAQSSWGKTDYRQGHDIVIPPVIGPPGGETWMESPYMLPARRKYLLSFQGYASERNMSGNHHFDASQIRFIHQHLTMETNDEFSMDFDCVSSSKKKIVSDEWLLCKTEADRASILKKSTFTLIPCTIDEKLVSTPVFLVRLFESLKYGVIPVILGVDQVEMPFGEVIDWRKAAIMIPLARISELHWLLRSIPDNDLLLMRRHGRILYDKYFATGQSVMDTILGVVRNRLLIPPLPIPDEPAISVFSHNFKPLKMDPVVAETEPEENLGPLEPPFDSPKFKRNFSILFDQNYEIWNDWGDPFHLYPHLPFDPLLPSDAKFIGSEIGFRAINGGAGGAGKEFCESLGGNTPKEQFTIVMLTYEREQVLINSLSRLHGLPYLNKVVVIWNSPLKPSSELRWPDIAVPIHVVAARKNSLNNRFLPFDIIETEAVLSVDDDAHLRHDEIIFGFSYRELWHDFLTLVNFTWYNDVEDTKQSFGVWREQRDRIVGFPGRYHALDLNYGGWLYNSNYSCELSMVLTGAAFVHKYYLYMYTYYLPQAIRDMVDQYMNCEDIAMNFLVSHITKKPPVKVTSRWTFRCPGCPVSLSEEESHFNERHRCINFFTKVFGYTPLLNTQFRVDSILFKTRIPHDKQKCFKFI